jgi:hypothetical protein
MGKARLAIGALVAAALVLALLLLIRSSRAPRSDETAAAATGAPAEAPAAAGVVERSRTGELRVAAGQTLVLESASFEPGMPVVVHLQLGEPSRTPEPRPVLVLGPKGRMLRGEGTLGDDRLEARFELDPAWLSPGHYLVQVQTTEPSHFPVRRYVLEVR